MNVVTLPSTLEAQAAAVASLTSAFQTAQQASQPVLLLLSGGSNLSVAAAVDSQLLANCTIYPLDERFSNDPETNNSLQLKTLGLPVKPLLRELTDTVAAMGVRFDQLLHDWKFQHPEGVIIATLGMGPDGHTAGISPLPDNPAHFDQLFSNQAVWAVGYQGVLVPSERVTVTLPFLTEISTLVALITGEAKKSILQAAVSGQVSPNQLPFSAVAKHPGLTIFTDQSI